MIYKIENGKATGEMTRAEFDGLAVTSKTDTVILSHHATIYRTGLTWDGVKAAVRIHESPALPNIIGQYV